MVTACWEVEGEAKVAEAGQVTRDIPCPACQALNPLRLGNPGPGSVREMPSVHQGGVPGLSVRVAGTRRRRQSGTLRGLVKRRAAFLAVQARRRSSKVWA